MIRLEYRRGLIALVFAFSLAMCLWLWFGDDFNQSRYVLKTVDGLTFRGWLAFLASLTLGVLAAPHLVNILIGRPMIEIEAEELRIWTFPQETIPLGEIKEIRVGDQTTQIIRYGAKARKLRVSLSREPRAFFFDEVQAKLGTRATVRER